MIYVVAVIAFFVTFAIVYAFFPYVAGLAAVLLGLGTPIALCVYLYRGWEIPLWQPTGLPEWQRIGVLAVIAGLYVGAVNRQLCVFYQAQQADEKTDGLQRDVRSLERQLSELKDQLAKLDA